jgi:hypothetical protein
MTALQKLNQTFIKNTTSTTVYRTMWLAFSKEPKSRTVVHELYVCIHLIPQSLIVRIMWCVKGRSAIVPVVGMCIRRYSSTLLEYDVLYTAWSQDSGYKSILPRPSSTTGTSTGINHIGRRFDVRNSEKNFFRCV